MKVEFEANEVILGLALCTGRLTWYARHHLTGTCWQTKLLVVGVWWWNFVQGKTSTTVSNIIRSFQHHVSQELSRDLNRDPIWRWSYNQTKIVVCRDASQQVSVELALFSRMLPLLEWEAHAVRMDYFQVEQISCKIVLIVDFSDWNV